MRERDGNGTGGERQDIKKEARPFAERPLFFFHKLQVLCDHVTLATKRTIRWQSEKLCAKLPRGGSWCEMRLEVNRAR
jgi:hypothetical protein